MSKRDLRQRACGKKIKHPNLAEAQRHAEYLSERDGEDLNAYRCQYCQHWHVGHRHRRPQTYRRPAAEVAPPIFVWIGPFAQ